MSNVDKRVLKTDRLIKKTFVDLLSKEEISKITIKEICDQAMISKSTFYDHYEDKYILLKRISDEYAQKFQVRIHERFKSVSENNTFQVIGHITKELSVYNQQLSVLLKATKGEDSLENKMRRILIEESLTYFSFHPTNKNFSKIFLAKMYTELALASISFTLINHQNTDLLDQQNRFINLLQDAVKEND